MAGVIQMTDSGTDKEVNNKSKEWPTVQPVRQKSGPTYNFRRGYEVNKAGRHETSDQYAAFQKYLLLQGNRNISQLSDITGHHSQTLQAWCEDFNWQYRAASYDKDQLAIVWKQAEKMQRNTHRDAIVEFRESSERQAKLMAKVSEDLLRVLGKRIQKAEDEGEEVPMALVSGLLRAAANISEQSRQSWANALGVNEMLEIVETEMNKVTVDDVTDVDAYEIPIDE